MTKFADQLFDDLMREHGPALARATVPAAAKRHLTARPMLLTAGAGGVAVAAAVGTLVAVGGTPAYAVTSHPDGTVTLSVYKASGIAGANSQLHQLGDRVVVVPVRPGCPSIGSLPAPAVPASDISVQVSTSDGGSVTVDAHGIPAGDILVLGFSTIGGQFQYSMQESASQGHATGSGKESATKTTQGQSSGHGPGAVQTFGSGSKLTSGPAPSCVSIPAMPTSGGPGAPGSIVRPGGAPVSGSSAGASVSSS